MHTVSHHKILTPQLHFKQTSNTLGATWMDYRSQAAKKIGVEEHKTWPLYEVIKASVNLLEPKP